MSMKRLIVLLVVSLSAQAIFAVPSDDRIREYCRSHEHQLLSEFLSLLSLPNLASDSQNIRRNAAFIEQMMRDRGLSPRLLEAKTPNVPPVAFAEWQTPGATRTIILYAHYD